MLMGGMMLIYSADRSPKSTFSVYDYFIDPVTKQASITKTLQVIAGITGTWIVTIMAINKTLTVDFFSVYLAAMGLSEAFSKFVSAKYPKPTE